MKKFSSFIILLLIVLVGWYIWINFIGEEVILPSGESQVITINQNGVDKDILETEGVKHSVPLEEIKGGGPDKDGIPSIDKPQFESIEAASEYLNNTERGIAFDRGDTSRFYPFQILVWHEIVNDMVEGQRVLVTYCPLCLSGIVFDPLVGDERVEFGVSGKLWNSNLVMYDRKTESLWSQALGKSIVGDMTGSVLEVLSFDQMRFGDWKTMYPNGEVLSRNTGASKFYGNDPYGNYYTTPGVYFPVNNDDDRLEGKAIILGLVVNGEAKAYLPESVKSVGSLEDNFAGKNLVVEYDESIDAVRMFEKHDDGMLERINPSPMFWFAWAAIHPETELYK